MTWVGFPFLVLRYWYGSS